MTVRLPQSILLRRAASRLACRTHCRPTSKARERRDRARLTSFFIRNKECAFFEGSVHDPLVSTVGFPAASEALAPPCG